MRPDSRGKLVQAMKVRTALSVPFALSVALALLVTEPAQAHYVYTWGNVYESDEQCVEVWKEISHGTYGFGYLKDQTYSSHGTIHFLDCAIDKTELPGYIRTHPQLWQDGGVSSDKKCNDWGWWQNTYSSPKLLFIRDFSGMPMDNGCLGKTGWYGTYAASGVKYNGVWYGDTEWTFSGWHCLPSWSTCTGHPPPHSGQRVGGADEGGSQSSGTVKDMPYWVDHETHIVNYERMPANMQAQMPRDGVPYMAPGAQGVGGDGNALDGIVIVEGADNEHVWTPDGSPVPVDALARSLGWAPLDETG